MTNWLNDFYDGTEELEQIQRRLSRYSKAFFLVGNDIMSDNLEGIILDIQAARELICNAVTSRVQEQYQAVMNQTGKTLSALLESAERKRKDV